MISVVKKKGWFNVALEDVATLQRGYDLPVKKRTAGKYVVFAANGPHGTHSEKKVSGPGVITGRSGTIGKLHFSNDDFWPLNTSLYVKDFHWNDPRWVFYMLKNFRLERFSQGAGVPTLNRNLVHDIKIPLPPLEEQKRIAAILDKADTIRRKRQAAIKLADDFLRATFLDMFGDPVTNPKEWEETELNKVAQIASGVTKGREFKDKHTVWVQYMRVANIQDGHIDLSEIKEIEVLESDVEKYALKDGDLLLTEGGDPDKLGRGAIWEGKINKCIHQNHIFKVRVNSENILPEYLSSLIGSSRGKRYFFRAAKQITGIASINITQPKGFPVLLPPKKLQKQYVYFLTNRKEMLK